MALDSSMMHSEAVARLRALMGPAPAPRPRAVWHGWWADLRRAVRHTPFKETRRGADRRARRLFLRRSPSC